MAALRLPNRAWTRRQALGAMLSAASAAAALAACGAPVSPTKPAATPPVAPAKIETSRPAMGTGKARLYVVYPPTSDEDRRIFQVLFDSFEHTTNGDVTIQYDDVAGQDVDQKVTTILAGGGQLDTMRTHPTSLVHYAARGIYVPTDDRAQRDNAEIKIDDLVEANYAMHAYRGKHYGLPYYAGPSAMYYNRDMFQQAGLPFPDDLARQGKWTWDAFLEAAIKLTGGTGSNKTFGINAVNRGLQYYLTVPIWSNGGDVVDDLKAPTKVTLDAPETMEALQFQVDLELKYKIAPHGDDVQALGGGGELIFKSGRVGMLYTGRYRVPDIKDLANFKPGHMPVPTGRKGRFMRDGGNGFVLMKDSKLRDETWQLVKFAASPEGGRILLKSTRPQPIRKSFYDDGTFAKALLPWEHLEFYAEAAYNDRIFLLPEAGPRFQQPFEATWDKLIIGQITLQQAVATAQPVMNELLKNPGR